MTGIENRSRVFPQKLWKGGLSGSHKTFLEVVVFFNFKWAQSPYGGTCQKML